MPKEMVQDGAGLHERVDPPLQLLRTRLHLASPASKICLGDKHTGVWDGVGQWAKTMAPTDASAD